MKKREKTKIWVLFLWRKSYKKTTEKGQGSEAAASMAACLVREDKFLGQPMASLEHVYVDIKGWWWWCERRRVRGHDRQMGLRGPFSRFHSAFLGFLPFPPQYPTTQIPIPKNFFFFLIYFYVFWSNKAFCESHEFGFGQNVSTFYQKTCKRI
ncbi:hypothetical protein TorRG33x02_067570 [Trema orientale]|uniref:Uncharacterized protein n=1 Tax=Trema orientale TaxID=63057 RepID=A0A2P5FIC5_TREOI|nr:hypothetical protein TorRG33x02_067570 [Trema orientale]